MKRPTPERDFDFAVVLGGPDLDDDEAEQRLYEAGCDDGTLSFRCGRAYVVFTRRAASLREAILSAVADVRKAGFDVLRTDVGDLVTQSDIARRTDRSRQQIHQFVKGTRGPGGFPLPVGNLADGLPQWSWCEVAEWLHAHGLLGEEERRAADDVAAINTALEYRHLRETSPTLFREVAKRIVDAPAMR